MVIYPYVEGQNPNHINCNSPIWDLKGAPSENVKLDVSLNAYDFGGNFNFAVTEKLEILRILPLAGPSEGGTKVKLIGSGFRAMQDVRVKWGLVSTALLGTEIDNYRFTQKEMEESAGGSSAEIVT